ncbi:MAG: XdhC family protein [Mycobacteriales bacterium]
MEHQHQGGAADPACAMAHGDLPPQTGVGTMVAVFASPVAELLLHFGLETGYRTVLLEPDPARVSDAMRQGPHQIVSEPTDEVLGDRADVIVTDHDRPDLGDVLVSVLARPTRWVGVMGSPRHTAPHVAALQERGIDETDIARVHRPIGLNIGSHSPAEIAIATLAGLIADRNDRPGGFDWDLSRAQAEDIGTP